MGEGILHTLLVNAGGRCTQAEDGEQAPLHRLLHSDGLILHSRPHKIIVIEVSPGPMAAQIQQCLQIGQGVVQPPAAGAAVNVKLAAALLQPRLHSQHGVRVILLHRHPTDMVKVRGLIHGVKVSQQQIRGDPRLAAGQIPGIRRQHQVPCLGPLPQAVIGACGKNEASFQWVHSPSCSLRCHAAAVP